MRKQTFCICENKGADQLRTVSATRIVQFLYFLNPKFPASSHLQCLYSSVCVVFGNHIVCFLMTRLILFYISIDIKQMDQVIVHIEMKTHLVILLPVKQPVWLLQIANKCILAIFDYVNSS